MKKNNIQQIIFSGIILVCLSGCGGNIKDWAEKTFYQTNQYKDDFEIIRRYMRGIRLYDQFTTLAIFDALWLSDEVRILYSKIASRAQGKDDESAEAFLRRQINANIETISFYVLSLTSNPLNNTPSLWTVYLDIDEKQYVPTEIKTVDLPFEYIEFFGNRINSHKQAYEIKFNKKDNEENDILDNKKNLKLYFSTSRHYDCMVWHMTDDKKSEDIVTEILEPALVDKKRKNKRDGYRPDPQEEYTDLDVQHVII